MELPTYTKYAEAEQARSKLQILHDETVARVKKLTEALRKDWHTNMPTIKVHEGTIATSEEFLGAIQDNAIAVRSKTPEDTIDFVEAPALLSTYVELAKEIESCIVNLSPKTTVTAQWLLSHSQFLNIVNSILFRNLPVSEINELDFDKYIEGDFSAVEIMVYSELMGITQEELEIFYKLIQLSSINRKIGTRLDKIEELAEKRRLEDQSNTEA